MTFDFLWNDPNVLQYFISLGREFQIDDPLKAKQFWPFLDFNLGGLKLKFELNQVKSSKIEVMAGCP